MSWEDIDRLFHAAAALAPSDRVQFLDTACAHDAAMRQQIEGLLAADGGAERLLREIVFRGGAELSAAVPHPLQGTRLGPYEIIREIGRGGMGEVFLARRADREFDKQVAIKLVRAGLDTEARRFFQERQILARLEHPNIARLLDGGTTPDDRPFLVMEYVEGVPVTEYRAARNLSVEQCCRLFLEICSAVEYAHRNLIVHRDLKPGNILVDAAGTPKLLDFGIAKLLEEDGGPADATTIAARPLTPHYASPEQISGGVITTASDVYMLGEVLFELLTGRRAHQIASGAPGEVERVVCLTPVDKPSDVNPAWRKKLAGDLDNIVLRALQKEPQRRYGSVEQLADDLRRYLDGRPVVARPDTLGYRLGKLLRRYPATAVVAALLILSIGAGVASTIREQRRTERRFSEVRQMANVFLFDFENAIRNIPGTAEARELVIRTGTQYLERLSRESAGNPALQRELAEAYVKMGDLQGPVTVSSVSIKGNIASALESYSHAIQLFRSIGAPRSPDPGLRTEYISVLTSYADTESLRDLQAGRRDAQEAFRLAEELRRANPDHRKALEQVARSALILARIVQRTDLNSALAIARQALAIREELVRRYPADTSLRSELASAWMRLSMFHSDVRDWANVSMAGARAVEILEQLHAANPADRPTAKRLMIAYIQHGKGLFAVDAAQGLAYLRKSVDLAEQIHAADPDSTDALNDYTGIHSVYGSRLSQAGEYRAATPYLERAVRAGETLARRDPGSGEITVTWAIDITLLAHHLSRQGDLAGAVRGRRQADGIFQDLLRNSPSNVRVMNLAAENLMDLSDLALESHDSAAAGRYADQALRIAAGPGAARPQGASFERIARRAEAVLAQLKK